jgi:hypothetical protein
MEELVVLQAVVVAMVAVEVLEHHLQCKATMAAIVKQIQVVAEAVLAPLATA